MTPARASRRRLPPLALAGTAVVVAGTVLLPLVFLVLQAVQSGWSVLSPLLFRQLTATLLWNTLRLTVAVTVLCAVIGVAAAWCTERTALPFRRFWTVALVLPLAVPDFVLGYGWISLAPSVHGYRGSVLVMTLGSYPLVYLPVAAALRTADPDLEEVARVLGLGRFRAFWRVTIHQIRPALLGGSLLVALILLAEFGTFEILRFQTFTTEIFTEFQIGFDTPAAVRALARPRADRPRRAGRRGGGPRPRGRRSAEPARPRALTGAARPERRVPVLLGLAALLGLAIGVPVAALVYWFSEGPRRHSRPPRS